MIMRVCPYCGNKSYSSDSSRKEWKCPYKDCGKVFIAENRGVYE